MCCDLCLDRCLLSLSPDLPGLSSHASLSKKSSLSPLSSGSLNHCGLITALCFLFPSETVSDCVCVCLSPLMERDLLEDVLCVLITSVSSVSRIQSGTQ